MESRLVNDLIDLQISVYAEINQKTSAALVQRGCEYEIGDRQREPNEASEREKKPASTQCGKDVRNAESRSRV
jgi:hypothetical protein